MIKMNIFHLEVITAVQTHVIEQELLVQSLAGFWNEQLSESWELLP